MFLRDAESGLHWYQLNEKLAASLSADFAFLVNCLQKELEELEETRTVSTICQEYVFEKI